MGKYLGTDNKGYRYYLKDFYVYQYLASGKSLGWLCSESAWERTFHKIITGGSDGAPNK